MHHSIDLQSILYADWKELHWIDWISFLKSFKFWLKYGQMRSNSANPSNLPHFQHSCRCCDSFFTLFSSLHFHICRMCLVCIQFSVTWSDIIENCHFFLSDWRYSGVFITRNDFISFDSIQFNLFRKKSKRRGKYAYPSKGRFGENRLLLSFDHNYFRCL